MITCRQVIISGASIIARSPIRSCAGLLHSQSQRLIKPPVILHRSQNYNEKLNCIPKQSRIFGNEHILIFFPLSALAAFYQLIVFYIINPLSPILEASKTRRLSVNVASAATTAAVTGASPLVSIIAVVVGWLVIGGSLFRSIPQIARIIKKQSAVGLSFTSIISELVAYVITVAYNVRFNYPFSTWGDILSVTIQQIVIIALVFKYNKETPLYKKVATVIGFFAASAFLFSENLCSIATLQLLQGCSALIMSFGARIPQIILNFRRGNSGELSGASTGLSVAGNLARVFTTIALVGDPLILATASSQLVLNSIVLYQTMDTARREKAVVLAAAGSMTT